ncbi:UDP-N-acetylmuramate--L-alanine ligase [Sediminispirochaeta bajacaliforniensis]|uniref:UDP-N-acetylmuramate--L-alanine ligase n=1 Tax=Sediminispirochaeta bajacaliforniensis TaxID=148 RepID=UPI000382C79B|nr:UDP-N-acetylmuramate--L-alanine ligase [Sediminispirochaeta bajacaliforniensis]
MQRISLCGDISGLRFHLVGIKGTGMAALAELLLRRGAVVSGSDKAEHFYTDDVLKRLGIPFFEEFRKENLPKDAAGLIYSAAYDPKEHPEILAACEQGIPVLSYTQALGSISETIPFAGIAGSHGKTTTSALAGVMARAAALPAFVLAGSAVPAFGGGSIFFGGDSFFIAETCEYRRHFLSFYPQWIVLTSVEADHLDYFRDIDDIMSAFVEYALRLSKGGVLIYCHDDEGASEVARRTAAIREDVRLVPYGISAPGDYRMTGRSVRGERNRFTVACVDGEFALRIPGEHIAKDALAAFALIREMGDREAFDTYGMESVRRELEGFSGSKRRSEILGEADGVLFLDDYGHHPTEIRRTLAGFREFYPERRIVIDFMSHTYSRTEALLGQFAEAFTDADEVILHEIYASAREEKGNVDGRSLFERVRQHSSAVRYYDHPLDALEPLSQSLRPGDLFVTMGAGNNWELGKALYNHFLQRSNQR